MRVFSGLPGVTKNPLALPLLEQIHANALRERLGCQMHKERARVPISVNLLDLSLRVDVQDIDAFKGDSPPVFAKRAALPFDRRLISTYEHLFLL